MRFNMQWAILFGSLWLCTDVRSENLEKVISCQLASTKIATLFRGHRISDTYLYSLQQENNQPSLLFDNEDESRGIDVKVECAGKYEQILVISGQFSSNYIQGLILRYNANNGQWERINFSERARPIFIYITDSDMSVAIPNQGNETDKKFIIYSYISGKGQSEETSAVDVLPSTVKQYRIHQ